MKRREFIAGALKRGAGFMLAPAAAAEACIRVTPALASTTGNAFPVETVLPLAPLGPPPLCVVPRGWDRCPLRYDDSADDYRAWHDSRSAAEVPFDWGNLLSVAEIGEINLGRRPATWREAAEWWGVMGDEPLAVRWREALRDQALAGMEAVGIDQAAPLPGAAWLKEMGDLCHEWRGGNRRFADGCEYQLPLPLAAVAGWPESVRALFVEAYEDAGAPWGHTAEAALLYIHHVGMVESGRSALAGGEG